MTWGVIIRDHSNAIGEHIRHQEHHFVTRQQEQGQGEGCLWPTLAEDQALSTPHPPRPGYTRGWVGEPRRPENCFAGGGWHGRRAKEGGGGAFQKWASVPGPLFCVRTDVAAKGAGTQILARKIFFTKKCSPTYV